MVMVLVFIFGTNLLVDDIINLFRPKHLQNIWSRISLISRLLLVSGASAVVVSFYSLHAQQKKVLSLANLSGDHPINVGMTLLSFGAGLEFLCLLRWLVFLETTGPIVLCVLKVVGAAFRMVSIYCVLFIVHGVAFWSLYKPFRPDSILQAKNATNYTVPENMKTQRGMFSTLFWRITFAAGPEMVEVNNTLSKQPFSMEFSHLMGLVLWGVYQITIVILMLNLLIAVINTSYSELWQNIDQEWKFTRCKFQVMN